MGDSSTYDPNVIIKAANEKLANNDLEGGTMLFQSALLDWVDDAREKATTSGGDAEQMREAIATLWIAYAHYLQKAKQFKSATEAYEQAVSCPVAGATGRIWLDYARFAEERGKLRTAQQVYIRALVGGDSQQQGGIVSDEQDRSLLWNEFLSMMQQNNPSLTLKELQEAAQQQQQQGGTSEEGASASRDGVEPDIYGDLPVSTNDADVADASSGQPPAKRPRINEDQADAKMEDTSAQPSRSHVVTAAEVNQEKLALEELTNGAQQNPDFMGAWMLRDGDSTALSPPEPPLFSAAPPKLSDPTGRDILGEELALSLIQRLLQPSGAILLEVCRSLWMLTALKENQAQKTLQRLDETVRDELDKMNARLDERLSVAGAAEAAVRLMNETERAGFQTSCNQQRQHMLNGIAWEFRQLLWVQQQLLTKLHVPGFDGTTVEAAELDFQSRVCSYLHSAFYLRKRIGEKNHITMLKSQVERLKQPSAGRYSPVPPTTDRYTPPPPPLPPTTHNQQLPGTYAPVPPPMPQAPQVFMGQQAGYPPGYPVHQTMPVAQQHQQQQLHMPPQNIPQAYQQQPPHQYQQHNYYQ